MKKIIISIILFFALGINIKANVVTISGRLNKENIIKKDYNFYKDKEQLGNNIEIVDSTNINQSYNDFCKTMKICNKVGNEEMRKSILYSGITEILDNIHDKLDRFQYRQFLINFNNLMLEHGFFEESREYSDI